jgi:DNA-binding NtrC family response regulator
MVNTKILVVEDEPIIRWDLAMKLQDACYETVEASSADQAIMQLEEDRSIRVVFTDIRMPGTRDGIALAPYVRKRWSPTLIVICSANIPPDVSAFPAGVHMLPKPYGSPRFANLLTTIAGELAASKS